MPLTLPNLDDRTYGDLVAEGRALIPTYASQQWTNHNPSDPGMTLIELFAYLAELLIYRTNRVTEANVRAFLKLLNGPTWSLPPGSDLAAAVRETMLRMRAADRAITCGDFEDLAQAADPQVRRARCVPRRDLETENALASGEEQPGHISVVIVPEPSGTGGAPQPDSVLQERVWRYLEDRRLLGTRVHVVGPRYVQIGVQATLMLSRDAIEEDVRREALKELRRYFNPLDRGSDGSGWPFGRNVYVSEIYQLLDSVPGVDYVQRSDDGHGAALDELVVAPGQEERLVRNNAKELIAVTILPDELIDAQIDEQAITVRSPVQTIDGV